MSPIFCSEVFADAVVSAGVSAVADDVVAVADVFVANAVSSCGGCFWVLLSLLLVVNDDDAFLGADVDFVATLYFCRKSTSKKYKDETKSHNDRHLRCFLMFSVVFCSMRV